MVTGAASAKAAVLVIDAQDGVGEQSRRHGYLLHLLGIDQIAVVINKMDLVGYSKKRFSEIESEFRAYLTELGIEPHLRDSSVRQEWRLHRVRIQEHAVVPRAKRFGIT